MEERIINLLQDFIVIVGGLASIVFLLPQKYAQYFNVVSKVATILKLGFEALERTPSGFKVK
jgi:hypothetical protein